MTAINEYLRKDLKYGMQETYLSQRAHGRRLQLGYAPQRAGFGRGRRTNWSGPNVMPDLAYRMKMNPKMKVMLAGGYFDLATPYFEGECTRCIICRFRTKLQSNISYHYYEAGHMIYVKEDVLKQFHADVEALYQATESGQ